ncbi:hypothetical protein BAX97_16070 [Elizabethkingia meningoseptica]|nr:hypothetical protein BBD33_07705 [Elizabethkingia meningoseptica]EOR28306.1 hypothetical protein L100_17045 [Elizabethkingia meningoseptica ATCC 13253 = NBRC 12535]AQX49052.1 hypothetical protein B5G46_07695 [Elizabethkingia meningoseptica]KUY18107.1 hypothetical protein ATB99_06200 [Elizabethkingia meningoseptica]MDE5489244.1 hypothetical protein [Elizabethkingia meningoseptica]
MSAYEYLLGKSKCEVIMELGDGFNFYPDNVWMYDLKKTWWGRKTVLSILFENNTVKIVDILYWYFKSQVE